MPKTLHKQSRNGGETYSKKQNETNKENLQVEGEVQSKRPNTEQNNNASLVFAFVVSIVLSSLNFLKTKIDQSNVVFVPGSQPDSFV